MFSSQKQPEFNWHDDDALHDQTPETRSILASLPQDAAAIAHILTNKGSETAKRKAIASLPLNDPLSKKLLGKGVSKYYNSMLHPPLSYRGNRFQYRSADGADNNILYPQLGKAGLPYAKSVNGKMGIHGARPDPGDLFDLLLARQDEGLKESESGLSSMLLYHATIIIHDIFLSNNEDRNISDTSSYLDLSPLYGTNLPNQNTVRTFKDGMLKPDTFAEQRLLLQPPGVCIYIIMYNRYHNYVAQQLREINENGKFSLPARMGSEEWNRMTEEQRVAALDKQDEDLFQTARLITTGLYINISIHDYLRCLMGLHAYDTPWTLDPRVEIPGQDKEGVKRGTGNQVSCEFNLLYRFHSPLSRRDTAWAEEFFSSYIRRVEPFLGIPEEERSTPDQIKNGEVSVERFKAVIAFQKKAAKEAALKKKNAKDSAKATSQGKVKDASKNGDRSAAREKALADAPDDLLADRVEAKAFPPGLDMNVSGYKFKRNPENDGHFDTAELVGEMLQVIEDPIIQFGAQNVPKIFKAIEILGMLQARKWEVATLNEFREFFGFPRHETFADINSDPAIQDKLRDLYEDPDMVELYPGLVVEGQGRCLDPGTSTGGKETSALWGGVFCDAVTLVRSDRFYTVDWNVQSLTSWGMKEVSSDPNVMKGSVMHRLFQRAFPGYLKDNSIHLWQPFYTPAMNLILAQEQGYLPSLDLSTVKFGGKPLGNMDFKKEGFPKLAGLTPQAKGAPKPPKVEATLDGDGEWSPKRASKPNSPVDVTSYDAIKEILGSQISSFPNVAVSNPELIPSVPLRQMWTGNDKTFLKAQSKLAAMITPAKQDMFKTYFDTLASEVIEREQRTFQKIALTSKCVQNDLAALEKLKKANDPSLPPDVYAEEKQRLDALAKTIQDNKDAKVTEQVYQLDVVKDFAIPVITRFVSDFLGFHDIVKTVKYPKRAFTEGQIYQHLQNCQDYLSYASDETMAWKRRQDFKKSIAFLCEKANAGASQGGLVERVFGVFRPADEETKAVKDLRAFGVECNNMLINELDNQEEAAAAKLVIALNAVHKAVLMFTEVLAFFVENVHGQSQNTPYWATIQHLALKKNDSAAYQEITKYVLEAQRLKLDLPVIRQCVSRDNKDVSISSGGKGTTGTFKSGECVVLHVQRAYENSKDFKDYDSFRTNRKPESYLIYGSTPKAPFSARDLTILAVTSMIKSIAGLKQVRVAHDKLGRLKKVNGPVEGTKSFMTPTWNQMVRFPTTWNIRYNGAGRGFYTGPDNADQGHGMDKVYQATTPQAGGGGTYQSGSTTDPNPSQSNL